jgi:(S)-mandelate dehydrogenase
MEGTMAGGNLVAYNIEDLRQLAKKRLPRGIFEYIDLGAEDYIALRNNRAAYEELKLKNRVLVDVSKRTTETEIFGTKLKMPYGISPTASAGITSYGGEIHLAKAAQKMGVVCTAATSAVTPLDEIYEAAGGDNLWFQLYMWTDMDLRMKFVERIRDVGYKTLIVTVDGPVGANREHNNRNGYSMPLRYSSRMMMDVLAKPGWILRVLAQQYMKRGPFEKENYPPELSRKLSQIDVAMGQSHTKPHSQSWEDIRRIRDIWPGNLLVKGLYSAEDAVIAADEGLEGVVLSNHGGRYVDCAPAPLQVLAETRAAVGDRIKIMIDSGPRRGSDIVKAVALGADLVMSGRPTLYGCAAGGEAGAYRALEIFYTEMDRIMAQLGLNTVDEIGPHIFWNPPNWVPQPGATLKAAAE